MPQSSDRSPGDATYLDIFREFSHMASHNPEKLKRRSLHFRHSFSVELPPPIWRTHAHVTAAGQNPANEAPAYKTSLRSPSVCGRL
ncbi:unnamed protein product [Menidia menidia]|uniref:(Atlantic silverside) hypothetical protein n=1 Tax=Menidia menidia TaxID=238744 RepID=A0A8S4C0R6_9TELE|nr:unnamed protein product [Menidia menidia]